MAGSAQLLQLVLLLFLVPSTALPSCLPPDLHALRSFAAFFSNSTVNTYDESAPVLRDLWTGENCCLWAGVTCTTVAAPSQNPSPPRVSELSLKIFDPRADFHNRPIGIRNILEPLCNLSFLSTIYLDIGNGYASFNTPIPACLGNMSLGSLTLQSLNLLGPVPTSFASLHLLQNLDLSYNRFLFGSLPLFSNLSYLRYLDLSYCAFSGSLLPFHTPFLQYLSLTQNFLNSTLDDFTLLSTLPSLEYLDLFLMSISGSLPPSINRLPSLTSLDLAMNFISGSLPASLTQLSNLHFLWLESNFLSGPLPKSFCNLTNLITLSLSDNALVAENDSLGMECKFINLTVLDMASNKFTGVFPPWIGHSAHLLSLHLQDNHFTGKLPEEWQNLRNLQFMDISGNSLSSHSGTSRLPDWLFRLPCVSLTLRSMGLQTVDVSCSDRLSMLNNTLLYLDLSNNYLTGVDVLSCFALHNFTKPLSVSLSSNPLSISISRIILTPSISSLDLSSCDLEGGITDKLLQPLEEGVPQLVMYLQNNHLMGKLPAKLCNHSTLTSLYVSHNGITGFEPCVNGSIVQLGVIDLSYNALEDDLPSFLATMGLQFTQDCRIKPWQEIDLSHNKLMGEIPSSLGLCATSLKKIKLNSNHLAGHIPDELGRLVDLTILTLANNHFSGNIPPSIIRIEALELLDLSYNELEGNLTTLFSFSSSTSQLRVLLLGHNKINGSIPPSFGAFAPNLQIIDLSHNNLSGTIPHKLQLPSFQISQLPGIIRVGPRSPAVREDITTTHKGIMYAEVSSVHLSKGVLYAEVELSVKGGKQQFSYVVEIMVSLDLSGNRLEGEIPSEVGELSGLLFLNLSHNSLWGRIPAALVKLSELQALDLSSNKLEGSIPADLSGLTKLAEFDVSFNGGLRGAIPVGPQFEKSESYRGDAELCGLPTLQACKGGGAAAAKAPTVVEAPLLVSSKQGQVAKWIDEWIALPGLSLGIVVGFGATLFILHGPPLPFLPTSRLA